MPGTRPNPVEIYRIVHVDNIEYLLTNGMFIRSHAKADPNYINIGDSSLIAQRAVYPVDVAPGGNLGDYVPFYFGPLSPMLLNIKTGYRGVTKRPQREIVYVVCELATIVKKCGAWCFTNAHPKDSLRDFFNDLKDLNQVYWNIVRERYWTPTASSLDKQARKQAEFLVKEKVPVSCIKHLIVYDADTKARVEKFIDKLKLKVPVLINPNGDYYYY